MQYGKVKWFNDAKGFGFIIDNKTGEELFVHYSQIESDGYKSLKENQEVTYQEKVGPKGKQATNVKPV